MQLMSNEEFSMYKLANNFKTACKQNTKQWRPPTTIAVSHHYLTRPPLAETTFAVSKDGRGGQERGQQIYKRNNGNLSPPPVAANRFKSAVHLPPRPQSTASIRQLLPFAPSTATTRRNLGSCCIVHRPLPVQR